MAKGKEAAAQAVTATAAVTVAVTAAVAGVEAQVTRARRGLTAPAASAAPVALKTR